MYHHELSIDRSSRTLLSHNKQRTLSVEVCGFRPKSVTSDLLFRPNTALRTDPMSNIWTMLTSLMTCIL
jgi:hypothetical protein